MEKHISFVAMKDAQFWNRLRIQGNPVRGAATAAGYNRDNMNIENVNEINPVSHILNTQPSTMVSYSAPETSSVAFLYFNTLLHKVLALSKFALLKCENEVNPVAQIS